MSACVILVRGNSASIFTLIAIAQAWAPWYASRLAVVKFFWIRRMCWIKGLPAVPDVLGSEWTWSWQSVCQLVGCAEERNLLPATASPHLWGFAPSEPFWSYQTSKDPRLLPAWHTPVCSKAISRGITPAQLNSQKVLELFISCQSSS